MLKIVKEDHTAFALLYDFFSKRLEAFSFSLVRSKDIAADVVEDVFIKLWATRSKIEAIENIAVYLYVAVKNQSLNRLSEKARRLITEPFNEITPQVEALYADPYNLLATSEMLTKMNKAIDTLPPRCKMIFKLVREDGLRYKEVSKILNISVNTIDAQMAIAVKRICQSLELPQKHFRISVKNNAEKK
jgi:RNA polymerase sigma-70 factor (ECF subfamily)